VTTPPASPHIPPSSPLPPIRPYLTFTIISLSILLAVYSVLSLSPTSTFPYPRPPKQLTMIFFHLSRSAGVSFFAMNPPLLLIFPHVTPVHFSFSPEVQSTTPTLFSALHLFSPNVMTHFKLSRSAFSFFHFLASRPGPSFFMGFLQLSSGSASVPKIPHPQSYSPTLLADIGFSSGHETHPPPRFILI